LALGGNKLAKKMKDNLIFSNETYLLTIIYILFGICIKLKIFPLITGWLLIPMAIGIFYVLIKSI